MSTPPVVKALIDLQLHLTLSNPVWTERSEICERIADLMGREILLCDTHQQQDWLIAKAWSVSVGKDRRSHRHSSPRRQVDWAKIRTILLGLTNP